MTETGMENEQRLLILFATQTGNAQDAAERVEREARRRSCRAAVLSLDEFEAKRLSDEKAVFFVVSTTGQGDTPDSMKEFWKYLLQRNLSTQWLEGVCYAVFGLGDSGYQKYNMVAKKLDRRLADLGAQRIIEKGLGDDQHRSGYEAALDQWLASLWASMEHRFPMLFDSSVQIFDPNVRVLDPPKYKIFYHNDDKVEKSISKNSEFEHLREARSLVHGKFHPANSTPHSYIEMTTNSRLTNAESDRDVRHFEFEILSSDIKYEVGDILEVLPSQNPDAVDAFICRCNLDADAYITVHNADPGRGNLAHLENFKKPVKLRKFVDLTMDIASASPRRYFFEVMSFFATAEHEKEKLQYFASPEGRDDLYQYNQKERRTVLEVLEDFPSVQMPFDWLVQLVPPLKTRLFSIASSPSLHPNQVHLTVAVVSWSTPLKRKRHGLCSSWLAGLNPGTQIPAWFRHGSLPYPSPPLPLILVGPGTGCAPFRGFIQEREVQSAAGPTAPTLFFFGCRNKEKDFLYKDFWLSHAHGCGVLSEEKGGGFFVAFSRDQPRKVYVQHKMQEESQRIWNLLSDGAAVYIAGSASKMPADVTSCLEDIISKEAGVPRESAVRLLRQLEKVGRFNIESWS
ncbi:NADPH-dependent diflavin oxidoreductase 1 [Nymphaea colorata]|nr:NADPH-dependent diflavin oxidoreductase 1 [Nymphaea colorata]